jgi:hypothetical protein
MPPVGPNPGVDNICGDETECFKLLRSNIDGSLGDAIGSPKIGTLLAAPVFRLSKLGFFLGGFAGGLIKEGEDGSDVWNAPLLELRLRARAFGFFGFRGDGDVMGRLSFSGNGRVVSTIFKLWKASKPNVDPEKEDNGTKVMGDSGEDEGEGSDSEDESTVDIVVVGDESVESEVCVEVLSRCWCECICDCDCCCCTVSFV